MLDLTRAGEALMAVGERGIVMRSEDDGKTWAQVATPVSVTLTGIQFVDDRHGWIVGHAGVVLNSEDGGRNWALQLDGKRAADIVLTGARQETDAEPADPESAAAALASAERFFSEGADKPLLGLHFEDANVGYVFGAFGLLLRTEDGGHTWVSWMKKLSNPTESHLYAMKRIGDALYIVGEVGNIFRSCDNGLSFERVESPYPGSFFGIIQAADDGASVAFGLKGHAVRVPATGVQATGSTVKSDGTLLGGARLQDGRLVLAADNGTLLVSRDQGQTFEPQVLGASLPISSVIETRDGFLVLAGVGGLRRVAP